MTKKVKVASAECRACGTTDERLTFLGLADNGFLLCDACLREAAYRYYEGDSDAL